MVSDVTGGRGLVGVYLQGYLSAGPRAAFRRNGNLQCRGDDVNKRPNCSPPSRVFSEGGAVTKPDRSVLLIPADANMMLM